jgi:polyisoprenoid-binding protein YceI
MPLSAKHQSLIGAAAVLAVAGPLTAQMGEKPGARDVSRITAGTYAADNEHTLVRWRVDHMGITPYFGLFGQITGNLVLDPANPAAAKVDVTIPVAQVTTASAGLTSHLLRAPATAGGKPDFFGPAPAPARFVSTTVAPDKAAGTARITGNLTLNGVTKPVTLDASFYGAGKGPPEMGGAEMVGFEATSKIKRSDFGIDMGIPFVSDEVDLEIVAAFTKNQPK